jgi:hypothetical protein
MHMHPRLLSFAPVTSRTSVFRLKALFSEERARESSDQRSKLDWEELAMEWHLMANLAADEAGEISRIDIV